MTITELLASLQENTLFPGSLNNTVVQAYVKGSTGTGLDRLVDLIGQDLQLNRRLPASEIAEASRAADGMNAILVEAIRATGVANDGWINAADLHDVSAYIREDA
ncbi:MAG: hypothetical protein GY806_12950, partial [Gammaproteobacteria bacterium]|nr:hypothetical protein [Gammaproteobacteria bacterium]